MSMTMVEAGKLGYLKSKEFLIKKAEENKKKAKEKFEQENKKCLQCGNKIPYEKRRSDFCNQTCSAIYNNHQREKKKRFCLNCNDEINLKSRKHRGKYCNSFCHHEFEYKEYINNWKNNLITDKMVYRVSNYIRRYLLEKYNNKCSKCSWGEINSFTKKIPLEIEHIDGNSENNKEENLILLCPNCHSLTSTYKGANRGNGRFNRRQRYKEGKSF